MEKATGVVRSVDELGRVVLPTQIAESVGITPKESVEILVDEEQELLILRKKQRRCMKCRSVRDLRRVKPGFYLCGACVEELK